VSVAAQVPADVGRLGRGWWLALLALGFFAWGLREYFLLVSIPQTPLRGDAIDYLQYARNLLEHGVFSRARDGAAPLPDAYRGPLFPLLLATALRFGGSGWYDAMMQLQALFGALSCVVLAQWTRRWLGAGPAWAAGALLALWPHHIAATGMLLLEVPFGLALLLGLWSTTYAWRTRAFGAAVLAGLAWGVASLLNPVVLLLPPAIAVLLALRRQPRPAAGLMLGFVLLAGPWEARSLGLEPAQRGGVRAKVNLVQGSWPSYHIAYASRNAHPQPRAIMRAIGEEEALIKRDTAAGLRAMARRMGERPGFFLRWYLWEKPQLLWDWDIRIGAGDVYVHPVAHSPLERNPVLHAVKATLAASNRALTLVAVACALLLLAPWPRRGTRAPEALLAAGAFLYLTLVHLVLQAEPRYATAYRAIEIALLLAAGLSIARWLARRGVFLRFGAARSEPRNASRTGDSPPE
jgi:hypothetical protein